MLIEFDDHSYFEMRLSENPGKVYILLGVSDPNNPLKHTVSSVEITLQQLAECISDLKVVLPAVYNKNNN
jgi:hypothetical protein